MFDALKRAAKERMAQLNVTEIYSVHSQMSLQAEEERRQAELDAQRKQARIEEQQVHFSLCENSLILKFKISFSRKSKK